MIPWLTANEPFPPVTQALQVPNGLLAAGGDLSAPRLLDAYRHGIFPWFNPGEPILWWSPDPRMVLIPGEFKTSRSLAKLLRNHPYQIRTNTAFEQVMRACAKPRGKSPRTLSGTWISEEMIAAYSRLHQLGHAHSVEVWRGDQLVGGLYGVSIGRMFYGESMFSLVSNASKIALAHLANWLNLSQQNSAYKLDAMIDCQMNTPHLASLGAREISRGEFIARLQELVHCEPLTDKQFDPKRIHESA